jgi:hypothetical protein
MNLKSSYGKKGEREREKYGEEGSVVYYLTSVIVVHTMK